jgi:hypothetical protein
MTCSDCGASLWRRLCLTWCRTGCDVQSYPIIWNDLAPALAVVDRRSQFGCVAKSLRTDPMYPTRRFILPKSGTASACQVLAEPTPCPTRGRSRSILPKSRTARACHFSESSHRVQRLAESRLRTKSRAEQVGGGRGSGHRSGTVKGQSASSPEPVPFLGTLPAC